MERSWYVVIRDYMMANPTAKYIALAMGSLCIAIVLLWIII